MAKKKYENQIRIVFDKEEVRLEISEDYGENWKTWRYVIIKTEDAPFPIFKVNLIDVQLLRDLEYAIVSGYKLAVSYKNIDTY